MKDFFNIRRFGRYLISDLKACLSKYWVTLLVISLTGMIAALASGTISMLLGNGWIVPNIFVRTTMFCIAMFVIAITAGAGCYGNITDRRLGAAWLMVPVSAFEKWLSMVLIITVLLPCIATAVYLLGDWLIALTSDSSESILQAHRIIREIVQPESIQYNYIPEGFNEVVDLLTNPLTYLDDIASIALLFLLGAMYFKKSKISKTILCYIGASIVISSAFGPVMFQGLTASIKADDPAYLMMDSWVFKNLTLIDTISDSLYLAAGLILTFIRIRTIKH
ncbi:MAG: hypothetical protein ACI4TM_11560 [Candidatus Cryptobacteroides sp.]